MIPLGRREVALVVSVRSLLPVLVPLAPVGQFVPELLRAVAEVLSRIEVSPAAIDAELREMAEIRVERTSSRQVLGSMTDFADGAAVSAPSPSRVTSSCVTGAGERLAPS